MPALFGKVLAPPAVADEVSALWPGGFPPAWLEVIDFPAGPPAAPTAGLGAGEAAALSLAASLAADRVLINERRGRAVAAAMNLTARGTCGVLLEAKEAGLVPEVRPLLDRLDAVGFYGGVALRARVLKAAGEADSA